MFEKRTKDNMTGTSTNTPTTVARTAPECNPNKLMETATANSKKFEALINAQGAEILNGILKLHALTYASKKIP